MSAAAAQPQATISGELKKWHRVTITFTGPETGEAATPNPFRDYRFVVGFRNGQRTILVPGFYAADGNAAETGAEKGNKWRVHFTPDAEGTWSYNASFRTGKDVAVDPDPKAGRPVAFDGARGTFAIGPTDKSGRDHRAKGMLRYVGKHYLQFAQTKDFFLKGGADSPENFLGYAEFDGTSARDVSSKKRRPGEAAKKGLHEYRPHLRDWRDGDPTWRNGRGKGIIGALNYLSGKGMNSVYFLTMNVGGDGKDVWPWVSDKDPHRFDCSKLDQWEIVFSHMDRLGILLHVITQETENDQLLDGGSLGRERKLYYRELIARFAHHPAVVWNLGEENTNTDQQRQQFCRYIRGLDPYDHPIVVHTFPGKYDQVYTPLLKFKDFEGPSLQTNNTHIETFMWVCRSRTSGRPWIVCLDEIGPAHTGVKPDRDDPSHDEVRKTHLWGNLMAGGAGCEWYFGYKFMHNDLNCEDWRSRERVWDMTRHALEFFQQHLPFTEMVSADHLTMADNDYCFAKPGYVYAVYLPDGGTTELFLPTAKYEVKWYNPRRGGKLQTGTVTTVSGRGLKSIGRPPAETDKDWAALVQLVGTAPTGEGFTPEPTIATRRLLPRLDKPDSRMSVTSFTLINADTNRPVSGFEQVKGHVTVNLTRIGTGNLNVVAHVTGRVGSVIFFLNGHAKRQAENTAPFAMAGDIEGDFNAWKPKPGTYAITAMPFSGRNASGRRGKEITLRLKITK